jgi:oligopeptide/dipeptide ABC transporter ATP-binding protein
MPLHPYTEALLSAVPIPKSSARGRKRVILTGDVPSPINPPPAATSTPAALTPWRAARSSAGAARGDAGHFAACHLHDDGVKVPLAS